MLVLQEIFQEKVFSAIHKKWHRVQMYAVESQKDNQQSPGGANLELKNNSLIYWLLRWK